jgi:hypothetical protein
MRRSPESFGLAQGETMSIHFRFRVGRSGTDFRSSASGSLRGSALRPRFWLAGFVLVVAAILGSASWAAEKIWMGVAADTLWSTGNNWSTVGAPAPGDNVTFTNLDFTDASFVLGGAANNVVDAAFSISINSLGYRNISGFHNTTLMNPLLVSGSSASDVAFIADDGEPAIFFIGSGQADGLDDAVYASINGSSLNVSNVNANLSVMQASATSGAHRATLDLTGLDAFTCVVSNILVGHDFGVPITRATGTLILATSNSITTKLISVSDAYQNAGAISYIHLGQVNTLNVDRIRIASHKCVGTVDFAAGLVAPSVTLRNAAGTGRQLSWELGDEYEPANIGFFTSNQSTGILDLTGARVDALVDRITLGRGQTNAPTRTGDGNGTLTFGGGTIDVNTLELGIQLSGGGSAGRGTLNVNNDDGVGAGSIIVRSNVVMAVQLPGNTEATGSTALISLNGGTMSVAGDIIDGGGSSTININAGGVLDLNPAGDDAPGNISVDALNISDDGVVTNYNTLAASTITIGGSATQFTVYHGQTLSPPQTTTVGALKITGDLVLRGATSMKIRKNSGVLTSDRITATGAVDFGGTLNVTFSGTDTLAIGNKFTLFTAPTLLNAFTTVNLPSAGLGLAWTNRVAVDGSIAVIASGEPTTPPTLSVSDSATAVTLSWPTTYTSFVLRGQTNASGSGFSLNWSLVPGVIANEITIQKNAANGSVFFELFHQ